MFKQFLRNSTGNMSIIMALSLVGLLGCAGAALDFSRWLSVKTELQAAADAAALSAVTYAAEKAESHKAFGKAREAGAKTLSANFKSGDVLSAIESDIDIDEKAGRYSAQVKVKSAYKTSILQLLSVNELPMDVTATAIKGAAEGKRINILIDNSTSMGIGASRADQLRLLAFTPSGQQCAVACHYNDGLWSANHWKQVRASRAVLRIDLAKTAMKNLISLVSEKTGNNTEFAIYTFSNRLTEVVAPTKNATLALQKLDTVDLVSTINNGGTNLTKSLQEFEAIARGKNNVQHETIIVSDGVDDSFMFVGNGTYPKKIQDPEFPTKGATFNNGDFFRPMPAAACKSLKAAGHTISTFNVKYMLPILGTDPRGVRPLNVLLASQVLPGIQGQMAQCASSPERYYSAESPADILKVADSIAIDLVETEVTRLSQ